MNNHLTDELLEAVWTCRESGDCTAARVLEQAHADADPESIRRLVDDGLVRLKNERIIFTETGERTAAEIIRRHRLAECLVYDVLGMRMQRVEQAACSFEHALVPEVTEGICTLLGHPRECPHGRPIPQGECCRQSRVEVKSTLMPLPEVPCGRRGRVAYVRPQRHERLHQLLCMGICPGAELLVHQRSPVLVIGVGHSEFAMDLEVAKDVYAWLDSTGR
jgi:DtxR family Mn-dependent transcriptional regulator